MTTRDRILIAGLRLYNARGVANVSNAHIAMELEISPGNLHYHFKNKLLLIEQLFGNFASEITALFTAKTSQAASLEDLWFILHMAFERQQAYCFIFRDTDYLLAKFPELEKRMRKLSIELERAAMQLCDNLRNSGAIVVNDAELESLATQVLLIYTQWQNFRRFYNGDTGQAYTAGGAFQILVLFKAYVSQGTRSFLEQLSSSYRCA